MSRKLYRILVTLITCCLVAQSSMAGPGDTTTVQTFTFGSPQEAKFVFPAKTKKWRKILMDYTLKCNPAQVPACGEWDYLTYVYLYQHTGKWDSTRYTHANYTWNGLTPDSLMFMNSPGWSYIPYFEYFNQTVPSSATVIGDSSGTSSLFFSRGSQDARSQFIIPANELIQSGLVAGEITAVRFNFSAIGSQLDKMRIRLKATTLDTLRHYPPDSTGFTDVVCRNWSAGDTGWRVIPFTYPFLWNGSSNLLIDLSYQKRQPGGLNPVWTSVPAHPSLVSDTAKDRYLKFRDMDYIDVPSSIFSTLDNEVTIAFWQYGDPLLQPQNNTLFEGLDSAGRRVINVHLPWSDRKVYWDAGNDASGYDRISQVCSDASKYRGQWNHWAFTKDAKKGRMKIYLNGQLWFMQGSRYRTFSGITKFRIGSDGQGTSNFYDGYLDEFSVWNKALSDTAIRAFMYHDIQAGHPDYEHLLAYFRFNSDNGFTALNAVANGPDAILKGYPEWKSYNGKDLFRNFTPSAERPCIVLEQGDYDPAALDSTLKIDTVAKTPIMIVMYGDTLHPYLPTDTLARYESWYHDYHYNPAGYPVDSTLVAPDGILRKKEYAYYGKPFELLEQYELARYITPYGNGLNLGNGWTWVFDLSDYASLLHDTVHLSAGNWQELLDMKFRMIEGTPPRDILAIKNIYKGTHGYANESQHNLPPVKVMVDTSVRNARLKMRITGHGFGGTLNCSEFCPRNNTLKINGLHAFDHLVWRSDCGLNPLYPQGGTWLYDRAEWCPGAEVRTTDFELSNLIMRGDTNTIDYDLEPGYVWDGQGSWPYYAIESQLVTYGKPNFRLDAALDEILSPNSNQLYNRFNPQCGEPVIAIKNNGSETLTRALIEYGPAGYPPQTYHWSGSLAFMDTVRIVLPAVDWSNWTGGDNRFTFKVTQPNGGVDEVPDNDVMTAPFAIPPTYDHQLTFKLKTNHMASSISWDLRDQDGKIIYHNATLENNTVYADTFNLAKGCYRISIRNADGEGLNYWANMPPYGNGTAGYARFVNMNEQIVKSFQGDFGREIGQSFTVGMTLEVPDLNPGGYVNLYPNPSPGKFTIKVLISKPQPLMVMVHDAFGRSIKSMDYQSKEEDSFTMNLCNYPAGVYIVTVISEECTVVKKLIKK